VLDINGLLCRKIKHDDPEQPGIERLHLEHYDVELRPGAREFLAWCYGKYDVGFYSSTTYPNCTAILQALLSEEQQAAIKFRLYREHTVLDPSYGIDPGVRDIDTIKLLDRILQNPVVNAGRTYHAGNTVVCDDSVRKLRYIPEVNRVIVPEFDGNPGDKLLACLRSMIAFALSRAKLSIAQSFDSDNNLAA